jgi:hypothetical protein
MKRISLTLLEPCFFKNIIARLSTAKILRHGSPSFKETKSSDEKDSILVKSTSCNDFFLPEKEIRYQQEKEQPQLINSFAVEPLAQYY